MTTDKLPTLTGKILKAEGKDPPRTHCYHDGQLQMQCETVFCGECGHEFTDPREIQRLVAARPA